MTLCFAPVADAPPVADTITIFEDVETLIPADLVLANDTDIDRTGGLAGFTYIASDGALLSGLASVRFFVADTIATGAVGPEPLEGTGGADWIEGGDSADTTLGLGGGGNDRYVLRETSDAIAEDDGSGGDSGGADTVAAFMDFLLAALGVGGRIETVVLASDGVFSAGGSDVAEAMFGNEGGNLLFGLAGADTLFDRGGDDTMTDGDGENWLAGSAGGDVFRYGNAAEGDDTILIA